MRGRLLAARARDRGYDVIAGNAETLDLGRTFDVVWAGSNLTTPLSTYQGLGTLSDRQLSVIQYGQTFQPQTPLYYDYNGTRTTYNSSNMPFLFIPTEGTNADGSLGLRNPEPNNDQSQVRVPGHCHRPSQRMQQDSQGFRVDICLTRA